MTAAEIVAAEEAKHEWTFGKSGTACCQCNTFSDPRYVEQHVDRAVIAALSAALDAKPDGFKVGDRVRVDSRQGVVKFLPCYGVLFDGEREVCYCGPSSVGSPPEPSLLEAAEAVLNAINGIPRPTAWIDLRSAVERERAK